MQGGFITLVGDHFGSLNNVISVVFNFTEPVFCDLYDVQSTEIICSVDEWDIFQMLDNLTITVSYGSVLLEASIGNLMPYQCT